MLLVVSECLKDRAFHIRTVYVNLLDPNGIVWRLGNPQFCKVSRVVSSLCFPNLEHLQQPAGVGLLSMILEDI